MNFHWEFMAFFKCQTPPMPRELLPDGYHGTISYEMKRYQISNKSTIIHRNSKEIW